MKKLFCIVSILLALTLLPAIALAQTQEEWNLSCNLKTSGSTTVYKIGTENEVQETIPANTYVRIYDSVKDMKKIRYMIGGSIRTGKVYSSDLVKCTSSVRGSSGYAEGVHELDPNHDEILKNNKVITVAESILQSGTTDYSDLTFELPDSPAAQAAQATAGRKSADKQQDSPAEVQPSVEASQPASTAQKKSTNSTQKKSASTTSQSTRKTTTKGEKLDMSLTMDVPEGGQLAVIYTPNTGKCSLREKASNSSKLIKQCKAGHLVLVLEKGSQFTKINDNGYVGYVQTRCLQFFDELPEAIGTAKLSYNGKATGGTTVNVRHTASKKSRKVEEWRTGTTVTVFSYADGWYEIEHDGVYGYVMDEFLIMDTAQE